MTKRKCQLCGKCDNFCPQGIREIVGQEYPVKELVKELMKDRMFYEQSGGGVTLSGGEVMAMSTDYILQIAKALKKEEISLTIDTCGYVSYDKFEAILPYVDTFLYDVKVMDPELHKKYIGVDNKLILDNLVKLSDAGARIYIRIPTIKEVNGNVQNMEDTIHFLKKHGIHPAQVNLLPYHNTGSSKYPKLGMEYKGTDLHAPEKEEMESFVKLFQDAGYNRPGLPVPGEWSASAAGSSGGRPPLQDGGSRPDFFLRFSQETARFAKRCLSNRTKSAVRTDFLT